MRGFLSAMFTLLQNEHFSALLAIICLCIIIEILT
jgi:hypothetical protein